jgi:hypothetical protein
MGFLGIGNAVFFYFNCCRKTFSMCARVSGFISPGSLSARPPAPPIDSALGSPPPTARRAMVGADLAAGPIAYSRAAPHRRNDLGSKLDIWRPQGIGCLASQPHLERFQMKCERGERHSQII